MCLKNLTHYNLTPPLQVASCVNPCMQASKALNHIAIKPSPVAVARLLLKSGLQMPKALKLNPSHPKIMYTPIALKGA